MIAARVLGIVALATFATQVLGEDDFPIVGTYTENTPCTGDGPNAARVTITAHEIDSAFGLCAILSRQREGPAFAVRVQCKSPDGTSRHAMTRPSISPICIRPIKPRFISAGTELSMRSGDIAILLPCFSSREHRVFTSNHWEHRDNYL